MLSVCIPVYDFDVRKLVRELHRQAAAAGVPFEILVFDDASPETIKQLNRELAALPQVQYLELPQNIGRSRIRNLLAARAAFPYLLFLDCDSEIPSPEFIARYLAAASGEVVVCGGRSYRQQEPEPALRLRWLYGLQRETVPAALRNLHPNRSFMTNNFLISKSLVQQLQFNEKLSGYGHEDTLFGYELKQRDIQIRHIENPAVHIGLETAEEFLAKTEQGVANLFRLYQLLHHDPAFAADIKLLRYFRKLEKLRLAGVFATIFRKVKKRLRENLSSLQPSLRLFDLYKLGLLCEAASTIRN